MLVAVGCILVLSACIQVGVCLLICLVCLLFEIFLAHVGFCWWAGVAILEGMAHYGCDLMKG